MQDRLTEKEIEDLLKEWKERGRVTLTGVPIEEWELKKRQAEEKGESDISVDVNGKGGLLTGIVGGGRVDTERRWSMSDVIVESMHGSDSPPPRKCSKHSR